MDLAKCLIVPSPTGETQLVAKGGKRVSCESCLRLGVMVLGSERECWHGSRGAAMCSVVDTDLGVGRYLEELRSWVSLLQRSVRAVWVS